MSARPRTSLAIRNELAKSGEYRRRFNDEQALIRAMEVRTGKGSSASTPIPIVYFVQMGEDGPVKIGRTEGDPLYRLGDLQTGSPYSLHLLGVIPVCFYYEETGLHRHFRHHAMRGEWFASGGDLIRFVEQHAMTWLQVQAIYQGVERVLPYDWFTDYFRRKSDGPMRPLGETIVLTSQEKDECDRLLRFIEDTHRQRLLDGLFGTNRSVD